MLEKVTARLERLTRLAHRLAERREEVAQAAGEDIGTPHWLGGLEVDLAVQHLRTMDEEVSQVAGKSPYGVVAAIFPYDAVPVMLARVGGAALLAGNRFRFSCSSQTPRLARLLGEITAPFPEIEAVTGMDNRDFGRQAVEDPGVRVLFISGGGEVGAFYARAIGSFDKLFFAGPSGLPPVLLFRDAPIAPAVRFLARRAFLNGGQYCTCPKRAYIHREIFAAVKERLLVELAAIKVGEPADPETWIGPLRVARTQALLERALAALAGAPSLVSPRRDGLFQGPFVLETADPPDMELFGPLLTLTPVASDQEAVTRVLASRYPMLTVFFGTPPAGAREQLGQAFGMVFDNPQFLFTPLRLPFGGKGESGWILEWQGDRLVRRDGALLYSAELGRPA
jgi:acyl-CoA reductase-like NAD-dependent aldehyde dehydrogenase